MSRATPSTGTLGVGRSVGGWLLRLRGSLLHGVRMVLGLDWGKRLEGLPGRGPCIQYQILLDARVRVALLTVGRVR